MKSDRNTLQLADRLKTDRNGVGPADWLERPMAIELLADALALYPIAREYHQPLSLHLQLWIRAIGQSVKADGDGLCCVGNGFAAEANELEPLAFDA